MFVSILPRPHAFHHEKKYSTAGGKRQNTITQRKLLTNAHAYKFYTLTQTYCVLYLYAYVPHCTKAILYSQQTVNYISLCMYNLSQITHLTKAFVENSEKKFYYLFHDVHTTSNIPHIIHDNTRCIKYSKIFVIFLPFIMSFILFRI